MLLLEVQQSRQYACPSITLGCVLFVRQNRAEAKYPPARGGLCIFKQTRRRCRQKPFRTVDLLFGATAREALIRIEFQLARCVIAAMAYETATLHQRPNVALILRCRWSRSNSVCCPADQYRKKKSTQR